MKLSETVVGGEYWFFGGRGPYSEYRYALAAMKKCWSLKDVDRVLLKAVRVNFEDLSGYTIQVGGNLKNGTLIPDYCFNVIDRIRVELS